jgi:hypothetical protein
MEDVMRPVLKFPRFCIPAGLPSLFSHDYILQTRQFERCQPTEMHASQMHNGATLICPSHSS